MRTANVTSALMATTLSIAGAVLGADFSWTVVVAMVVFAVTSLLGE